MNMKTNITILAASLLFCACSSDNEGQQEDLVPITLTATMIVNCPLATRTTSTDLQSSQFASGQTFSAYFTSSSVVPQSTVFTADGLGGATPASQPYFKLSGTTTDVRAYYPSTVTESTTSFVVEADQTTDASYRNSDLMYASATIPKVYPTSTGELAFAHKMAKVRVQTVNNGSSVKTITLKSVKRQVPFTASTGALGVATASGSTDVTMFDHAGQTSDIDCVALIPPQTMTSGTTLIEVTTVLHNSSPLTYQLPANISFASGMQYIFTVNVHEESLIVSCNVTAWGTGNTASTAVNIHRDKRWNPLYYVAEYNLSLATDNTTFSFNKTESTSQGSMFMYTTTDGVANHGIMGTKWVAQTSGYDGYRIPTSTNRILEGESWHLPTRQEFLSIVPAFNNTQSDGLTIFTNLWVASGLYTEPACVFGYNTATKTATAYKSYWDSYTTEGLRYAIRFLDTNYCSVWKYQIFTNKVVITAKIIERIASTNTSALSAKIAEIKSAGYNWTTLNADDGEISRTFYACGLTDQYKQSAAGSYYNTTYGRYWTTYNNGTNEYVFVFGYPTSLDIFPSSMSASYGMSVRLFRDY